MGITGIWVLAEQIPSVIQIYDWLAAAAQFWHAIENTVLIVGMALVVWLLRRERRKIGGLISDLGERIETMSQLAKAARDEFEAAIVRPVGPISANNISNWETVQAIWRETRDRMEFAIEEITDRRIKPKYGKIARYNYNDIIITLRDDGIISSDKAFAALVSMNGLFQRLKLRPAAVTAQEAEQFKSLLKEVNGALPKLPKIKNAAVSPAPMPVAAE